MAIQCLICNLGEMRGDTRDLKFPYRGQTITVEQVLGMYCDNCSDAIFSIPEHERLAASMKEQRLAISAKIRSSKTAGRA